MNVKAVLTRSQDAVVLASSIRPTAYGTAASREKVSVVSVERVAHQHRAGRIAVGSGAQELGSPLAWSLAKLGIEVARSTVAKYMLRDHEPPSPTRHHRE